MHPATHLQEKNISPTESIQRSQRLFFDLGIQLPNRALDLRNDSLGQCVDVTHLAARAMAVVAFYRNPFPSWYWYTDTSNWNMIPGWVYWIYLIFAVIFEYIDPGVFPFSVTKVGFNKKNMFSLGDTRQLTIYLIQIQTNIRTFYLTFYCIWHSLWHFFWHSIWHFIWHSIWHSLWHVFWHVFWHSIWHSIWHIFWHFTWRSIRQFIWHSAGPPACKLSAMIGWLGS